MTGLSTGPPSYAASCSYICLSIWLVTCQILLTGSLLEKSLSSPHCEALVLCLEWGSHGHVQSCWLDWELPSHGFSRGSFWLSPRSYWAVTVCFLADCYVVLNNALGHKLHSILIQLNLYSFTALIVEIIILRFILNPSRLFFAVYFCCFVFVFLVLSGNLATLWFGLYYHQIFQSPSRSFFPHPPIVWESS